MCKNFFNTNIFWLEIASLGISIFAYILIIVQGSINYMLKNYKTRSLIAERLLYEQFSYEVFESIKSYPYALSGGNSCFESGYSDMTVEVKSEYFYDCRDVYDQELNEHLCQNEIVDGKTCCKSECCFKTNGDVASCYNYLFTFDINKIKNHRQLYYNDEEYFEDPRRRFCTYYNIYARSDTLRYYTSNTNLYRSIYNYKDIYLSDSIPMYIGKYKKTDSYLDCGIIDTKKNHLYVKSYIGSCPINGITSTGNFEDSPYDPDEPSREIIIRNIFSDISPKVHEWKEHFISLENYENKSSDKYNKLKDKISRTRNKDFKNVIDNDSNIYYKRDLSVSAQTFSSSYPKVNLNLYTTNYIGFESREDIETFINNFNEINHTDNLLYRFGKEVYPSLETIICGSVLIVLCIIYLILFTYFYFKLETHYLWLFIVKQSILGATFLIELVIYIWKVYVFKRINIDMDSNFKIILKLYNTRRIQLWLLFGLIFLFISIIAPFVGFLIMKYILRQPQNENNQDQGINIRNNQDQGQERNIPNNQNQEQEQERNIPNNQNQDQEQKTNIPNNQNQAQDQIRVIPFSLRDSENQSLNDN